MNKSRTIRQALSDYIPEDAVQMAASWFDNNHVILRITRNRSTKLGDFRGAPSDKPSYISVNHNLNKYSFLITLLHEMAHADVHFKYSRRIQPHGKIWKAAYQNIAAPYLQTNIFPDNLRNVYRNYLSNPQASSTSYLPLASLLKEYDNNSGEITVSMLQAGALFEHSNGKIFRVIEKLRKRYRCFCIDNKKTYLFSPIAVIKPLQDQKTGTAD